MVEAVGLGDGAVARGEKVGEVALRPLAVDPDHKLGGGGGGGGGSGLEASNRSARGGAGDDDDDDEHG